MVKLHFPKINLSDTFECGQCFRWNKLCYSELDPESFWSAVVDGEYVEVYKEEDNLIINSEKPEQFWKDYFDYDYKFDGRIISAPTTHEVTHHRRDEACPRPRDALDAVPYNAKATQLSVGDAAPGVPAALTQIAQSGQGIRILKQSPWETLISFIISQNNNIPRIKGIISRLCENFGEPIIGVDGNPSDLTSGTICHSVSYKFPTPSQLLGQDLSPIRAGFRDKYLLAAAEKCVVGADDLGRPSYLQSIASLPTVELRQELMQIKGVGKKIADCVMLFAYHRLEIFPQDVWIIRIMKEQFGIEANEIDAFAKLNFGNNAGYIQQYLYHYFRNLKNNLNN